MSVSIRRRSWPAAVLAIVVLSGLLALFTSSAFVTGQEKRKSVPSKMLPGPGVADPAAKIGFFCSATGGIDALELTNGKLLWTSKEANRPLLATEDRLFAQKDVSGKANQIRIVVLDLTKHGKRVLESEVITLPDWVSVNVAYGRSYRSSSKFDGDSLLVSWEARAFYAGGAAPTPAILKAARKEASGVMRIDVVTGKFGSLSKEEIPGGHFFPITNDVSTADVGDLTLSLKDTSKKDAKNPFQQQRLVQGVNAAKTVVWEHEIAAPVFLIPLP
jgi:hypothetical protein